MLLDGTQNENSISMTMDQNGRAYESTRNLIKPMY